MPKVCGYFIVEHVLGRYEVILTCVLRRIYKRETAKLMCQLFYPKGKTRATSGTSAPVLAAVELPLDCRLIAVQLPLPTSVALPLNKLMIKQGYSVLS